MVTIYLLRHRESGRCYVGRTRGTLKRRMELHSSAARLPYSGTIFTMALNVLGIEAFDAEVLETVSPLKANSAERAAIERLRTRWPEGFNVMPCNGDAARLARLQAGAEFGTRARRHPAPPHYKTRSAAGAAETGHQGESPRGEST